MAKSRQGKLVNLRWPYRGLNVNRAFVGQKPDTCADAQNVRNYDPQTGRSRGSQRWGFSRLVDAQVDGANQIQCLDHVIEQTDLSPAANTLSVRTLTGVVVSNGTVKTFGSSPSSYSTPTNGSGALESAAPFIQSARLFCDLYFADGLNWKYYDRSADEVKTWSASAGSLPSDSGNLPRLIVSWRNRIVLSGIKTDAQNWFMSAMGTADDFDYAPSEGTLKTQAIAGNNSTAGYCPDAITTLIPYNDDLLIMGGDHSIYVMAGDPADGGFIQHVSSITGMAWGEPWCISPDGSIFFFGSRGGFYHMPVSGDSVGTPQRISANSIEERLAKIDMSNTLVRVAWEDRHQHVLITLTPLDGSATTHYAYDVRGEAFWPDVFADNNHNPTAVHTMDGDAPGDRVILYGGQDGYVRALDYDGTDDDDQAIDSYVLLGPVTVQENTYFLVREIQAAIDSGSNDVTLSQLVGENPETAFDDSSPYTIGTLTGGRNQSLRAGKGGHAAYFKLRNNTAGETWQFENMKIRLRPAGRSYSRSF